MATSSIRFFESPIAVLLYPNSGLPPASAVACSHPAAARLPEPPSHPSHPTSPSSHRWCASIHHTPAPRPRPSGLPPPASAQRSSAPPCACSSTCSALTPEYENRTRLCAELGGQVTVNIELSIHVLEIRSRRYLCVYHSIMSGAALSSTSYSGNPYQSVS